MSSGRLTSLASLMAGTVVGAGLMVVAVLLVIDLARGDAPVEAMGPPVSVEESGVVGHVYDGEFQYFVGGGVAVFDCDDDGFPELYLAGGSRPAGLYHNESAVGGPFVFSTVEEVATDLDSVTGAYPLDVDSDGITDLAVLRVGENVMLRGLGDCRFERANEEWGIEGGDEWTVAFSATWEEGETLPSLVFGNYLVGTAPAERQRCDSHYLHRPQGGRYQGRLELTPGWCTLSVLFSDWGRSGRRDLRMTNDRHYYRDGEEQLWRVDPGAPPVTYTEDDGWQSMQIWGMGIASHDLTGDGIPEVFLTSQGDNKLQQLVGDAERPSYEDIALALGATAHRPFLGDVNRPSTAWHAEFADVNNDGFIDLFVSKGNVEAMAEFAMEDPNNLLLGDADGSFREAAGAAGVLDFATSRGAAIADLNRDGLLDLVVVERREPTRLWRNTGGDEVGNWLMLDITQPGPNRDAVGAWVEVALGNRVLSDEIVVGGGHAGGQSGWVHFGVGRADQARVRVVWPDGQVGDWQTLQANGFWILERDAPARRWSALADSDR